MIHIDCPECDGAGHFTRVEIGGIRMDQFHDVSWDCSECEGKGGWDFACVELALSHEAIDTHEEAVALLINEEGHSLAQARDLAKSYGLMPKGEG
jgi:hypothetical protein